MFQKFINVESTDKINLGEALKDYINRNSESLSESN